MVNTKIKPQAVDEEVDAAAAAMWQRVSDEYVQRVSAGQETSIEAVAAELGVDLDVGYTAAAADAEQEQEAHEWSEALLGDALP